jgi:hypothetical protein
MLHFKTLFFKKIVKEFKLLEFKNKNKLTTLTIYSSLKDKLFYIYGKDKNSDVIKNSEFYLNNLENLNIIFNLIDKIIKLANYSNLDKTYNFYLNSHYINNFIHQETKNWFDMKKLEAKIYNEVETKIIKELNIDKKNIKKFLYELDFFVHELALLKIKFLNKINYNIPFLILKKNIKKYIIKFIKRYDSIPNGNHEIQLEYFNLGKFKYEKKIECFNLTKEYGIRH